jgi:hypothetical protein
MRASSPILKSLAGANAAMPRTAERLGLQVLTLRESLVECLLQAAGVLAMVRSAMMMADVAFSSLAASNTS